MRKFSAEFMPSSEWDSLASQINHLEVQNKGLKLEISQLKEVRKSSLTLQQEISPLKNKLMVVYGKLVDAFFFETFFLQRLNAERESVHKHYNEALATEQMKVDDLATSFWTKKRA